MLIYWLGELIFIVLLICCILEEQSYSSLDHYLIDLLSMHLEKDSRYSVRYACNRFGIVIKCSAETVLHPAFE